MFHGAVFSKRAPLAAGGKIQKYLDLSFLLLYIILSQTHGGQAWKKRT
jgi:hypothetical protein